MKSEILFLLVAISSPGRGAEVQVEPLAEKPEQVETTPMQPGWLPAAGALVPGVLVHGTGHFLGGDNDTAWKLLAIEGAGITAMAAGLVPIATLDASRKVIGLVAFPITLVGAGLFVISGSADLYGSIAGGEALGSPETHAAWVEARAGAAWVHDPQFAYSGFAKVEVTARAHGLRLSAGSWVALDDDNQRSRLELAFRLLGPRAPPAKRSPDGTWLELQTAVTWHRYGSDGFEVIGKEVFLAGRYDMGRLADSLRGSFAELGLGWGLEYYGWQRAGLDIGQDKEDLLLMRIGYGLYLGQPGELWGEAMFFYDHRHDDFAAGTSVGFVGDGVPGHFGLDGFFYLTPSWGLDLQLQAGSAWIVSLGARWRLGSGP